MSAKSERSDPTPVETQADDVEETTARREYTEALAMERELAKSGQFPVLKPSQQADTKELLQPPEELLQEGEEEDAPAWPQDDRVRVLVIEGDKAAGGELVGALNAAGYAALAILGSDELIQRVEGLQPHLILLRVELSPRSGYLVCNQLRQHEQLRGVPLVLVSSEATKETFKQHRKLATRADAYLIKPFTHEQLTQSLSKLTGQPSVGAASAEPTPPENAPASAKTVKAPSGLPTWLLLVLALLVAGAAVVVGLFVL